MNPRRSNGNGGMGGWGWLAGVAGAAAVGYAAYQGMNTLMDENPMQDEYVEVVTTLAQSRNACYKLRE